MNDRYAGNRKGFWRRVAFPLGLGVASVALTSAFFLLHREQPAETRQRAPVAGSAVAIAPKLAARLYFASREGDGLVEELREIEGQGRLLDQMAQTLRELIKGPRTNALPVIPEEARLNAVYLDDRGVAYVDFSPELVHNHPGGTNAEELTAYAIVNSLAANYSRVAAVQLLVDGAEIDTLAGHLDMRHPVSADFSLVKTE